MRYNPALDGIRAIAITLVLFFHAHAPELRGGFIGVDVFFVLSGYLITNILLAEIRETGTISLGSFYLRRLQRLYPPMLAVLLAYVVIGPYLWPGLETPLLHAGIAAIYMSDYANILSVGVGKIGYLWSLAVEEKFYLLWPLGLIFVVKRKRPIQWMLVLVLVSTAWRFVEWANGHSWTRLYFSFDTHASGLMIGSALAVILTRHPVRSNWVVGLAAFLIILVAAKTFRWKTDASILYGRLVVELATVALVLSAQSARGWLASAPLVFIGKYSYGLYLWHMPIMVWLRAEYNWPVTLLVGSVLGMLLSIVSYHTIEAYFRKHKKSRMHAIAAEQSPR